MPMDIMANTIYTQKNEIKGRDLRIRLFEELPKELRAEINRMGYDGEPVDQMRVLCEGAVVRQIPIKLHFPRQAKPARHDEKTAILPRKSGAGEDTEIMPRNMDYVEAVRGLAYAR